MMNLPTPLLGDVTAITIGTSDLENSLRYYQRLGFRELYRFDFPYPFIQVTDGALLLMLRKNENPYLALTYYVKEIDRVTEEMESRGFSFLEKPRDFDKIKRYLFKSPDDLNITLVEYMDGFFKPNGPSMLGMPPDHYFKPETYVNQKSGMFGELAHPVKDLDASIAFWEKLGYKVLSKNASPYPWSILSDGLAVVGLHQTDQFSRPAITFFASDMGDKIEQLKAEGLTDYREFGHSANIILNTPEQQVVNLFRLG